MNRAPDCIIAQRPHRLDETTMREPILAWPDDIDGRQVTFAAVVQDAAYLLRWMTAGQAKGALAITQAAHHNFLPGAIIG
jgi:hypothetical protein